MKHVMTKAVTRTPTSLMHQIAINKNDNGFEQVPKVNETYKTYIKYASALTTTSPTYQQSSLFVRLFVLSAAMCDSGV